MRSFLALRALILLVLGLAATTPAIAQANYTRGHGDLHLGSSSSLSPHVQLDAGAVVNGSPLASLTLYEPSALVIVVGDAGRDYVASVGGRPSGSAWDPVGVSTGSPFWILPQDSDGAGGANTLGLPWFGFGGYDISLGAFDGNVLNVTLTGASRPAGSTFSMWTTGFGGSPTFHMTTTDGIGSADVKSLDLDVANHEHVNWGFSHAGTYDLQFTVSGTVGGSPVEASATYRFVVSSGSTPATAVPAMSDPLLAFTAIGMAAVAVWSLRRGSAVRQCLATK